MRTMVQRALTDPDEYRWCHVKFLERIVLAEDDEPSRFLQHWHGRIEWEDPERRESNVTLGAFSVYLADLVGAMTEGVSAFDVFDTAQSTFDLFQTLFDLEQYELLDSVKRLAFGEEYPLTEGVLILDRLTILPAHRGHAVGLLAMKALVEQFRAAAGIVVLKAFPLQFEGGSSRNEDKDFREADLELESFTVSSRTATSKLKKHYSRIGFVSVPRTEYMVLDPSRKLPDYDALVARTESLSVVKTGRRRNLTVVTSSRP